MTEGTVQGVAKAAIGLPWAMSLFGVQQMTNLITPPAGGRTSGAAEAFDAVSQVAEQQLDGWLKATYAVGTGIQNGVIDVMMLRPPEVDPSLFMRMASEMPGTPLLQAVTNYVLSPIAWISSFMVASQDSAAVQEEFANKLQVIQLVTAVESLLGLDPAVHAPLPAMVERAERFASFPRLWAIEGLGNYYAERAWDRSAGTDPQDLLTDPSTATLPASSLTMLHAGIGMSFANRLLRTLHPDSPPGVIRATIVRFAALCRRSSRPGYAGAAYESLGLAARTLYPNLVRSLDRELQVSAPDLVGYFWHGVGRAMYFEPASLLPAFNAPWRAVATIERDMPHETARLSALSGLSWAMTLVNMRTPEVMGGFLRHHATTLERSPAFSNGVTSSLLMRFDTTPDDQYVHSFVRHQPVEAEPAVRSAWDSLIARPCTVAFSETYPRLRQAGRLEDLFH